MARKKTSGEPSQKSAKPKAAGAKKSPPTTAADTVLQLKITLIDARPPIWRRIQIEDCTLDKLHWHIQAAMGWSSSHLYEFEVGRERFGDPELLDDGFEDFEIGDSTRTKISDILPKGDKKFRFKYEYDFGDSWQHEILFERHAPREPGKKYPVCTEGERACPPEDVGGMPGYEGFLECIGDKSHEARAEWLEWIGGSFDAEQFDPEAATKNMRRGLRK